MPTNPLLDPGSGFQFATAALGSAADRRLRAACAEMTAQVHKMTAAAFGPAADTLAAAAFGPGIRQLVRRDGPFALYGQLLDTVRTPPSIDPLPAERSRRPIFTPMDAVAAMGAGNNSPARDELPAATQTSTPSWIEWERRYSTELLLLATLILIVFNLLAWLDPQATSAPSQPGRAVTSSRHGSVSGISQEPSCNDRQSEICSPGSSQTVQPGCYYSVKTRSLATSR